MRPALAADVVPKVLSKRHLFPNFCFRGNQKWQNFRCQYRVKVKQHDAGGSQALCNSDLIDSFGGVKATFAGSTPDARENPILFAGYSHLSSRPFRKLIRVARVVHRAHKIDQTLTEPQSPVLPHAWIT